MKKCAVVIPNYKTQFSYNEEISFSQCISVLGKYDIFFVSPYGIENKHYSEVKGVVYYSKKFFENRDEYSYFMLKKTLYEDFIEYEYILIYQLDAFVFRDELLYFCNLGYDYIGAPWPYGACMHTVDKSKIVYVGNGGFSLRRVSKFVEWIDENEEYIKYIQEHVTIAEDYVIAFVGKMRIAPIEVASEFAIEDYMNDGIGWPEKEPFGAHSVFLYNFKWAKEKYSRYGYQIEPPSNLYKGDRMLKAKETLAVEKMQKGLQFSWAINSILNTDRVCVWGTGFYGKKIVNLCKRYGIAIEELVETKKKNDYLFGVRIVEADEWFEQPDRKKVVVAMLNDDEVTEELERHGYLRNADYTTVKALLDFLCYCE